jgi:predicted nucleic acid-binding protein
MLVLVDTSAWIGFFARSGYIGVKARLKMLLEDDQAATAGPIVLELLQGCRSVQERVLLEERLQALHWLDTQTSHWFAAGRTFFALRRAGVTVAAIDVLIATLAEAHGCGLLQLDRDFERIARHTELHLIEIG